MARTMASDLEKKAAAYGIISRYKAIDGEWIHAPEHSLRALLDILAGDSDPPVADALPQPWPPPPKAPQGVRCFLPDFLEEERAWGVTCQLYSLRSERNWGIGDLEDLARLAELAAQRGADFLGVNPLHALLLAAPERCSPFSPSHRNFLNPIYIAVDALEGFDGEVPEEVQELRASHLVQYQAVASQKLRALRRIWQKTQPQVPGDFIAEGANALWLYALFEALSQSMVTQGFGPGWHSWPEAYQHPGTNEVRRFGRDHADELDFHIWLQWVADQQLEAASKRAREAGMRIGLYLDQIGRAHV